MITKVGSYVINTDYVACVNKQCVNIDGKNECIIFIDMCYGENINFNSIMDGYKYNMAQDLYEWFVNVANESNQNKWL